MLSQLTSKLIDTSSHAITENFELLNELDRAIGDGDHGTNMHRGMKAIVQQKDKLVGISFSKALQKIGTTLVMHIGGAAGPLYGSFFLAMGKAAQKPPLDLPKIVKIVTAAIATVKKRGKSDVGAKTMLDVLGPVGDALIESAQNQLSLQQIIEQLNTAADNGLASTKDMLATKGRASFLGERSIGHLDPGAKSSQLLVRAVMDNLQSFWKDYQTQAAINNCVGIVIVSHSEKIACGASEMVFQMVGDEVPLAWCGGNLDRGLGTDVAAIQKAIETVWNPSGVAVLVDLGGAETNSEMAIEMLPKAWQSKVVILNAPIVEGAVMAATEAAGGGSLEEVRATAEELSGM